MSRRESGKQFTVAALLFGVIFMATLTAASAPLYRLFCQVTGYGGTPTEAVEAPGASGLEEMMTVRFNADTARGMAWDFTPMQRSVEVSLGEQTTVFYEAANNTDQPIAGISTFNVTPLKVGIYFAKIECFCFTEQVLQPGQRVAMPVTFFVDPEIHADPLTSDVRTITLSYTFFEVDDDQIAETKVNAVDEKT